MLMQMKAQKQMSDNSVDAQENVFSEFYNEYFPRVYNYVCYRVSNYNDADDLTSIIFYKLFEKRSFYCSDKAPRFAWVFSIARNTVTDYYRRHGRNTYAPLEDAENMAAPGSGPEDIVEMNETRQHLRRALMSLSDRERDIIALKFWSGMNNREIAKVTGLSESNIGVILYRAMRCLRSIMEMQGGERQMTKDAKAERYLECLDRILAGEEEPEVIEDQEVQKLLKTARNLMDVDFSIKSKIRDSLRQRIIGIILSQDKAVQNTSSDNFLELEEDELLEEELSLAAAGSAEMGRRGFCELYANCPFNNCTPDCIFRK